MINVKCGTVYYAVQGVLTFESVDKILKSHHSGETSGLNLKAIEQYFPVVLFIVLYKVVLTFESG